MRVCILLLNFVKNSCQSRQIFCYNSNIIYVRFLNKQKQKKETMVVEKLKLHSNYLHPNSMRGLKLEGRINKLQPDSSFGIVTVDNHDMCVVNNREFKDINKTIETRKSNGLVFRGYDDIYRTGRAIVDKGLKNRNKYLAKIPKYKRLAEKMQKNHPLISKIVNNKFFQKAMKFMNDNALLSDATIALFYTCVMRPLSISALPTKDEKEKQKNVYQIGHSISTGIIGFITAFAIQTPIKTAIDKVITNASKYIDKANHNLVSKEKVEKLRSILERSHQPISLPLKAALTIYLVPKILKLFGLTKNSKQNDDKTGALPYDAFKYFASFKGSKSTAFQSFSGGLKDAVK